VETSGFPPSEMGKDSQWSMVERGMMMYIHVYNVMYPS
jgi:hypothetical protein